jgi:hypothetical protein
MNPKLLPKLIWLNIEEANMVYMLNFDLIWFLMIGALRHFQQYFSYIMTTSFSGGRIRGTWREPPTMGKQLVNFITCGCESNSPFL